MATTKYKGEIERLELNARLNAQQNSRYTLEAEVLKLKARIEDCEATIGNLNMAIAETETRLKEL